MWPIILQIRMIAFFGQEIFSGAIFLSFIILFIILQNILASSCLRAKFWHWEGNFFLLGSQILDFRSVAGNPGDILGSVTKLAILVSSWVSSCRRGSEFFWEHCFGRSGRDNPGIILPLGGPNLPSCHHPARKSVDFEKCTHFVLSTESPAQSPYK